MILDAQLRYGGRFVDRLAAVATTRDAAGTALARGLEHDVLAPRRCLRWPPDIVPRESRAVRLWTKS